MTMRQNFSLIAEEFHVTINPIYNKEDDVAFIYMPSQKKVEIGEKITITVKNPNKKYDEFCEELTELIMKYNKKNL